MRPISFILSVVILSSTLVLPQLAFGVSDRERELKAAIESIENGYVNSGLHRIKYQCEKLFYTDACDYLRAYENRTLNLDVENAPIDEGFRLYDKKDYRPAFKIFNHYCSKYNSADACFMVGLCYSNGQGVTANPTKALSIFSSPTLKDRDGSKLQSAYIEEYDFGNEYSIRKAMGIYNSLARDSKGGIQERAKEALIRGDIYDFLGSVFRPIYRYFKDDISYSQLENALINANTARIPVSLKDAYISWRLPFLKLAENKSSGWDTLWHIGKSAVKGFLLDFSFVTDAVDLWQKDDKLKPVATEERHYYSLFVDQLKQYKISAKYWNSLQGK